jgi:transposase
MQSVQLPAIEEVRPEYCEINAQVLQAVLHHLDRACAAFFRRVTAGARPGYPRFQGQDCSGVLPDGSRCTQRVAKSLSVRTHICPSCGLVMDRDENAAQHIRRAGQARQARMWPVAASVA